MDYNYSFFVLTSSRPPDPNMIMTNAPMQDCSLRESRDVAFSWNEDANADVDVSVLSLSASQSISGICRVNFRFDIVVFSLNSSRRLAIA